MTGPLYLCTRDGYVCIQHVDTCMVMCVSADALRPLWEVAIVPNILLYLVPIKSSWRRDVMQTVHVRLTERVL